MRSTMWSTTSVNLMTTTVPASPERCTVSPLCAIGKGWWWGLTCRFGRAVYGTSDIISDIIEDGKSLLLLGRPGVGKTTMLREVARILAEKTAGGYRRYLQ